MNAIIEVETYGEILNGRTRVRPIRLMINVRKWLFYCRNQDGIELWVLNDQVGGNQYETSSKPYRIKLEFADQIEDLINHTTPEPGPISVKGHGCLINPNYISSIRNVNDRIKVSFNVGHITFRSKKDMTLDHLYEHIRQQLIKPAMLIPESPPQSNTLPRLFGPIKNAPSPRFQPPQLHPYVYP